MHPGTPLPLLVSDSKPGGDPELDALLARAPGLDCVRADGPGDRAAAAAVARALLEGRAVRVRGDAGPVVEAGRRAAGLTIGTLVRRADEWLDNVLASFETLVALPDLTALDGCAAGRPALVVGAGPSLDAIPPEVLSALAERSLVVAAGSALAPLGRRGLAADIGVLIEGADCSAQLGAPARLDRTALALAQHGHPAHLRAPAEGFVRVDLSENAWFAELAGSRACVPSGGNVGMVALGLALRAGCEPVVLAGLDFALGDAGAHHADGSSSGPFGRDGGSPSSAARAGGGTVATNALLDTYRLGVEAVVARHAVARVINLVAGDKARIAGTVELGPPETRARLDARPAFGRGEGSPTLAARHPAPGMEARASRIVEATETWERAAAALVAGTPDRERLRALLAAPLARRPGSLAAALYRGFVLDPDADPAEAFARRRGRGERYRRALLDRVRDAARTGRPPAGVPS